MANKAWTIKGVSNRTRAAALEAAHAAGLTVGEWIDRTLAQAAEEARHPKPTAATRDEVAEIVARFLDDRLAPLVRKLGELEEKISRPDPSSAAAPSPIEALRSRGWRRRGR